MTEYPTGAVDVYMDTTNVWLWVWYYVGFKFCVNTLILTEDVKEFNYILYYKPADVSVEYILYITILMIPTSCYFPV